MERMAFSRLIWGLCLIQVLPFISAEIYRCQQESEDIFRSYGYNVIEDIMSVEEVLTYNYRDYYIEPSTDDYTTLVFDNVKVNFQGHLQAKGVEISEYTDKDFDTNRVVVHREHARSTKQCKVHEADFLKKKYTGHAKLDAIYALTKVCLEEFVCKEWDKFTTHDTFVKQQLEAAVGKIFNKKRQNNNDGPTKAPADGHDDTQNTWNAVFDIGKSIAIDQLIGKNEGLLVVPETRFDFKKWKIHGHVTLKNITIQGLTSLERVKDLVVHRFKHRYELSTGLELTNLNVTIPKYEGTYGNLAINGAFGAKISKVAVSLKASIDYNSQPCKIEVEELKKDNLEEPKVQFNGLGVVLNWPVRKFAEHFIRNNLFDTVRDAVAEQIKGLNCERFRSSFESAKF